MVMPQLRMLFLEMWINMLLLLMHLRMLLMGMLHHLISVHHGMVVLQHCGLVMVKYGEVGALRLDILSVGMGMDVTVLRHSLVGMTCDLGPGHLRILWPVTAAQSASSLANGQIFGVGIEGPVVTTSGVIQGSRHPDKEGIETQIVPYRILPDALPAPIIWKIIRNPLANAT